MQDQGRRRPKLGTPAWALGGGKLWMIAIAMLSNTVHIKPFRHTVLECILKKINATVPPTARPAKSSRKRPKSCCLSTLPPFLLLYYITPSWKCEECQAIHSSSSFSELMGTSAHFILPSKAGIWNLNCYVAFLCNLAMTRNRDIRACDGIAERQGTKTTRGSDTEHKVATRARLCAILCKRQRWINVTALMLCCCVKIPYRRGNILPLLGL